MLSDESLKVIKVSIQFLRYIEMVEIKKAPLKIMSHKS